MSDNIFRAQFGAAGPSGEMSQDPGSEQVAGSGSGGGPTGPGWETRIAAIEATLARLDPLLIRLDERTTHLATKEDVALLRSELADKAGRGTVWLAACTVFGLVVASAALGAVYMPYLATLLRRVGP